MADSYESARGKDNRVWKLYNGQIIVTFVLKPKVFDLKALNKALISGIITPLIKFGARIKLPNDFFIGDKKIGGMLTQVYWSGNNKLLGIVVGFSINCNNIFLPEDELYNIATSIKATCNLSVNISSLQNKILDSLDVCYKNYASSSASAAKNF